MVGGEPRKGIVEMAQCIRQTYSTLALLAFFVGGTLSAQSSDYSEWFPGTSSVLDPEIIPYGFRGTWAPDISDCKDKNGVALMTVYHDGIDFYESGARLRRITQSGQFRSVKMRLEFEGEGDFWDRTWNVMLSHDSKSMVIQQDGSGSEVTYVRCE